MEGVEEHALVWDSSVSKSRTIVTPRVRGKGLFVSKSDLVNVGIFRIHEFPGWIFCTDDVKNRVQQLSYTNVGFLEMGDSVSSPSDGPH